MLEVSLRSATQDDFAAFDAIRAAAFAPVFASLRALVGPAVAGVAFRDAEREQQNLLRDLLAPGEARVMLVAVHDDLVQGFCAVTWNVETRLGEISLNAVRPRAQRQGIGARLYAAALDRMRAGGMQVASVTTGADDGHKPARAAYAKVGFAAAVPCVYLYRVL